MSLLKGKLCFPYYILIYKAGAFLLTTTKAEQQYQQPTLNKENHRCLILSKYPLGKNLLRLSAFNESFFTTIPFLK